MTLKTAIFTEVRKTFEESEQWDDLQLNTLMFREPDGLRLSLKGFMITKKIFTAYSFEIPVELKSRHRIGMSKMEFPYFLTSRRLVLFSEMDSSVIKLAGGIENFLETCSQLDS